MKSFAVISAAMVCVLLSTSAFAICHTSHFTFRVARGDAVTAHSSSDGVCHHQFRASGRLETVFISANIATSPHSGTLAQTGAFAFKYNARNGFKGTDSYAIKICGKSMEGNGCSTITYDMTVN